jgi:hypothetical protein
MRALEFGPFDQIIAKYGSLRRLEDMPRETTLPAVVFKPSDSKSRVISWDHERALALWAKRQGVDGEPLPDIFALASDVTGAPQEIVGRNRLVLKPRGAEEQRYYTTDDE